MGHGCGERKGHLEKNLSRRHTVDQMIREVPNLSLSLLCENLFFLKVQWIDVFEEFRDGKEWI